MSPDEFDWRSGRVEYWDLNTIDAGLPLKDQVELLGEDLAQVRFPGGAIIDVGWYPAHSRDGVMVVYLIADEESWDEPLMKRRCTSVPALRTALATVVAAAERGAGPTP